MTHSLVYLDRGYKVLKETAKAIGKATKDNYYNDKREFIEGLVSMFLTFGLVIVLLQQVVFPIPAIPKQTALVSPLKLLFVVMKDFWLHILALLGCVTLLNPRINLLQFYIHRIFSIIIKVRNYIVFVRNGQGKITQ